MRKENEDGRYNGWANYETWAVSLWLDNDESSYRYWREVAAGLWRESSNMSRVVDGYWTRTEAASFDLAEQLKEAINDGVPLRESSLYSDLLLAAIAEVDWLEIAKHWLIEIECESAPENTEKT